MKLLSDEEIISIANDERNNYALHLQAFPFARAIEAKVLERIGDPVRWINPHNKDQIQALASKHKVTGYTPLYAIGKDE